MLKRALLVFAGLVFGVAISVAQARADIPLVPAYGSFTANGQSVVAQCPQGQSSALVYVDNSGSFVGTVTVTTSPINGNGYALAYGVPYSSVAAGSASQATTISSFPGKLYVTLGSDAFVRATVTAYTSGTAQATIQCSSAVARAPSAVATSAPAQQGPSIASTAFSSLATGTTANTNVQLPCGTGSTNCSGGGTISLTLGTSNLAKWYVTFEEFLTNGGISSTGTSFGCNTSTSTFTTIDASRFSVGFPCANSTASAITGTGQFGQSGVNSGDTGLAQASFYAANGATIAWNCFGANSSTTSLTLNGYCKLTAVPSL